MKKESRADRLHHLLSNYGTVFSADRVLSVSMPYLALVFSLAALHLNTEMDVKKPMIVADARSLAVFVGFAILLILVIGYVTSCLSKRKQEVVRRMIWVCEGRRVVLVRLLDYKQASIAPIIRMGARDKWRVYELTPVGAFGGQICADVSLSVMQARAFERILNDGN